MLNSHPKVQDTPMPHRMTFLKGKGLTDPEIEEAKRRAAAGAKDTEQASSSLATKAQPRGAAPAEAAPVTAASSPAPAAVPAAVAAPAASSCVASLARTTGMVGAGVGVGAKAKINTAHIVPLTSVQMSCRPRYDRLFATQIRKTRALRHRFHLASLDFLDNAEAVAYFRAQQDVLSSQINELVAEAARSNELEIRLQHVEKYKLAHALVLMRSRHTAIMAETRCATSAAASKKKGE